MWRKLLRAGPRGWYELAEAQVWLLWARFLVRFRPRGKLISAGDPVPLPPAGGTSVDRGPVERIEAAISRASRYGLTRPKCLVRSIALQRMLVRHGIDHTRVRFGVRMSEGAFESHAWVEWQGRVIGDDPQHVRTYMPLDDLALADPRNA